MGLDISIRTDKDEAVFTPAYEDSEDPDYFSLHSLSRTFCNLVCRKDVIEGEPELDQMGRITGVDIGPLYEMEHYHEDGDETLLMFMPEEEEERQKVLTQLREDREKLTGNLDLVMATVDALIARLSGNSNLPQLLTDNGYDTLDNQTYFADFNTDTGDGYIGNNFGQDLRNFKRFLEYAKSKGAGTVYFSYG